MRGRGNVCYSSLARWKAHCRFPLDYNCTFLLAFTAEALRRNRPLLKGWVTLGLNIMLNGYLCCQHLYTVGSENASTATLPQKVYTQINFVADFIRLNLNVIQKITNSLFEPPFGELGVTYALHL